MNRRSRSQIALALAVALLAVITFTGAPGAQANHTGGASGDDVPIVTTIPLVVDSEPGDLTAISDEVHVVPALEAHEAAVERILSI